MTGFSALPLADAETANDDGDAHFEGVARILGPRWSQLPVLTIGLVGVQVMWSVEMSYASPYLISLGMSKSLMAMVFLAGPISGLVVQPLIGVLADNSKSRFGRRRPYILSGVALCSVAILLLGFTRQVASIVTTFGSSANDALTVGLAILAIYCIDFGINAVQAVDRALLVDTLPPSTQASGNAWAARMLGIGSVAGFFIGNIDLPSLFPNIFGEHRSELQLLSVMSAILIIGTHLWTASMVKERIFVGSRSGYKSFRRELRELWENARTLPYVIRQICIIQFFAWLAWFPILFYTTLYIGDLYRRSLSPAASTAPRAPAEPSAADDEATRLGARAQLYSALLALATNVLAPFIVNETRRRVGPAWQGPDVDARGEEGMKWWEKWWSRVGKIHLATLWAMSHAVFTLCMFATFFTDSVGGATFLMTITGFSWGITQWAPFSLLAEAILTTPDSEDGLDPDDAQSILLADTRTPQREEEQFLVGRDEEDDDVIAEGAAASRSSRSRSRSRSLEQRAVFDGEDMGQGVWDDVRAPEENDGSEDGGDDEGRARGTTAIMGNADARRSGVDMADDGEARAPLDYESGGRRRPKQAGLAAKAGIIIGIHNIFIVVPQFLVTGLSSLIFAIFEPDKSVLHGAHPGKTPPGSMSNSTAPGNSTVAQVIGNATYALLHRQDEDGGSDVVVPEGPNAVAIIFRLGGLSSAIAFVICWRLATELRKRY
ncbi:MFS general substrate transporter [Dentipellis sp. KUC8613]|nr:MFS general substrate transporter [Dentipellis sp. KUC8613]